jgi:molecular chaperone GrpE
LNRLKAMSEHDQSATPDQQNDAAQNSTESASGKEADVFAIIDALNAENAQLKDKALRTMADMENLRRRTEKEVVDARTYAVSSFARDMLTVADNMRRGIESVPQEQRTSADGALKTLLEGVELTERDLLKTLEKYGIKQIDPQGQRFDPNLHQAMFEVEDTSVTTGTVVQVVQAGFVIGERVLRPALVGVSKGGPKPGVDTSA